MTAFIVFAVIVLIAVAVGGLVWFLSGRSVERPLVSARHGGCDNANVDYAVIDRQSGRHQAGT